MDFATLVGIVVAVVSLIIGFTSDGGTIMALIQGPAFIIVVGGTLGATLASVKMKEFTKMITYLKVAFTSKKSHPLDVIEELVQLATVARREGILALEERVEEFDNEFMKSGVQFVVDGVDPELVKNMLETELSYVEERHEQAANIFEMAGGYSPTMGIIGTVMGLVHVLGNLGDVNKLGPQIATAFTATLYGVALANVFWLPIATKLRRRSAGERLTGEIIMEGILSIQAGENPNILNQKLRTFLAPADRERKVTDEAGEANAEAARA